MTDAWPGTLEASEGQSWPGTPEEHQASSGLEAGATGVLQGATGNWSDEMMAASAASGLPQWVPGTTPIGAARLAYEHVTGQRGPASETYERTVKELREHNRQLQQEHPYLYGAGELGGAAATVLAAPGPAAATIPGRIGAGALTGAGYGAVSGAGEGEGGADTLKGAGTGALTGAAFGTVGVGAAEALSPLATKVGNVVRGIRDPDLEASRRIASHVTADWERAGPSFTPEELAAANAAGTPRAIVDTGGESTRALARSAANTSQQARAALTEFTQERFEQQSPRIAGFIRGVTGGGNAADDLERIQDVARRANRPAYRAAYAAGEDGLWTPELERLAGSPAVRRAMQSAVERGRDRAVSEGYGAFNPGVSFENGVMQFGRGRGAPPYPNMQFWDYTQRELRDAATAATRSGRNEEAGALNGLRRNLLTELDAANPAFRRARQGAAQFFGAENALEAGQNFVKSSANINEARRAYARMSPAERELFARGYASNLADAVERAGTNRNVLNSTFLNNTAAQQRTVLALGPGRARQLEALLRAEGIVNQARTAISGNSTTARQLMEMGLAGGATAGAEGLLEQDFNPTHILTGALMAGAVRHGAQVIDQRVARRVGEMLVSNDPRILARGLHVAARNPAIVNALRQATGAFSRGATEAVETSAHKPGQGFEHGGVIYRASGGRVNPANIDHSPTEAQKAAGNYAKDHVSIHGLDIAIENAKGKKREGVGRDGKKWSVKMPAHYGYIKRTMGKDGDHVDVYLGPHIKSPRVYVVDQHDADSKKFDEHKAFIGFGSAAQVRATYRKAFSDGRGNERLRDLTEMSVDGFKHWLAHGDTTKPLKRAAGGRAEGGDVSDDDALAASMTHWPEGPNPAQPYLDAATRFGTGVRDTLMAGPRLMGDVMEGRLDPNSPEAIRRSADVALNTAGMGMLGAERGAVGALGGRGFQAPSGGGKSAGMDASKPASLSGLRDALIDQGWRLDHASSKDGVPTSFYLSEPYKPGVPSSLVGKQIRISDHELGTKHGEKQGGQWSTDVVVNPELSLADHLEAVVNDDYRNSFDGFSSGYSHPEFIAFAKEEAPEAGGISGALSALSPADIGRSEPAGPPRGISPTGAAATADETKNNILEQSARGNTLDKQPLARTAIVQKRGENNFLVKSPDNPDNRLAMVVEPDAVRVKTVDVRRANRNAGVGVSLYEKAIAFAAERGLPLRSDITVTNDALHVYDALRRRGYDVTEMPGTTTSAAGKSNEKHVFEVRGIPQRASGGRIIGAKSQSEVGLAENSQGVAFRCHTCDYMDRKSGACKNPNSKLHGRPVKPHWCCNLYDHAGMKVIA